MISGFSYLTQTQENKWIYYAAGQSWQVWDKPDGCNMIHIAVIGAGAGGGGGYQHAAGATGGGGGGGAASGVYTMMIPAYVLPDKIYIQVGVGGAGGANLAAGAVGGITYIGLVPDSTITSANLLISHSFGTGGGGAGSATGGSGGGTSSISWTLTLTGWGKTVQTVSAQAGTGVTALDQTRIVGGGAGGAFSSTGATLAGNSVTSAYKQPSSVTYSAAQPTTGGITKAGNGPRLMSPQPQFFGGAGGASFSTTTAANGGDGDIGCGGGGAGPNLTGGSSTGGRGGDGMVIITCW
jgi:hypothetical protein